MKKRLLLLLIAAALMLTTMAYGQEASVPVVDSGLPPVPPPPVADTAVPPQAIRVGLPASITGHVDPFNINGRGQIDFSNIVIENNGSTPIHVILKEFTFTSETIEVIGEPITEDTQGKKVYLWLEDEQGGKVGGLPIAEQGGVHLGTVEPEGTLVLRLNGQANQHFFQWSTTDKIQFSFGFSFEEVAS